MQWHEYRFSRQFGIIGIGVGFGLAIGLVGPSFGNGILGIKGWTWWLSSLELGLGGGFLGSEITFVGGTPQNGSMFDSGPGEIFGWNKLYLLNIWFLFDESFKIV